MESKELLLQEIVIIEKWEKEQEDLWFFEKWGKFHLLFLIS